MKDHPYLTFGPTNDEVGLVALALGLVCLALALVRVRAYEAAIERIPGRWLVGGLAVGAAAISGVYIAHYLQGGPRVIDATAYWLEARALSAGDFAFRVPEPSGSFRGRFLLPTPDGRLSVIFPPGYPLLLAAGFSIGVPLLVGPVVAGLLVVATYWATRTLLGDERVARVAALISTLCATLRYHTADTMSHGLSALLFVVAIGCAARKTNRAVLLSGLLVGWLVATRPVTGGVACALIALFLRKEIRLFPYFALGGVPGLSLFVAHARVATGSWLGSTQLAYYALSDGPPGCFHYGFGSDVGCRFEHGDFVKEHLANGFGPFEAAWITLERLALHGIDVANFFPLSLLLPWAAIRFRSEPGVRSLALAPLLVVLAYAPFYYPASYPGAGARLFADALPLEHALLGLALVRLHSARFVPAVMLLGFALHGVHQHRALAEREGGKPMFVRSAVGERRGIVYLGTDHGFLLGHDPEANDPRRTLVVARRRGDAHDRVLWERLGRPPAYRYDYDVDRGTTNVTAYRPGELGDRFETEAEWPPLAVASGWAHPDYRACLSGGQGLHLRSSSPGARALVEIELVAPTPGRYELTIGWLADPQAELGVSVNGSRAALAGARNGNVEQGGCFRSLPREIELVGPTKVRLDAPEHVIVDYLELTGREAKKR